MTATLMDGKATLSDILGELAGRIEKLAAAGITPGLGTLLVGDDPGSHSYVRGKHRDCAKVGIASLQRELPADATQADVERAIDELNADPACTGFIVQLPLPRGLDAGAALERIDPAKDADGLHPVNLGRLVLGEPGPLPCTPRGIVELCRRYEVRAGRRPGHRGRPRRHRRPPARAAADPAQRERHRDPVPHRHPGPGRRGAPGGRRGRRGRRAGPDHRGHGAPRRHRARRRRHAHRPRAWSATSRPRSPRWPGCSRRCRAGSAR